MDKLEKQNYRLGWKWSKKLERSVRTIKIIQVNAFDNYLKSNPTPSGISEKEWKFDRYSFYKEAVYAGSIISNVNIGDYKIDFISASEGIPDDNDMMDVGFKIWKDDWELPNGEKVYVKFLPCNLFNGCATPWETNSSLVPPSVEEDIYKNVFPQLYKSMKLLISNVKECVKSFEMAEAERDFNVKKD